MRKFLQGIFLAALGLPGAATPGQASEDTCVVLLHGLTRSPASMWLMQRSLEAQGYRVVNQAYPSRSADIETLAEQALPEALEACRDAKTIHFVTHSMGGILLWYWVSKNPDPRFGRAVLLGPPSAGSEIVDRFQDWKIFRALNGPAGLQLGTEPDSFPNRLPQEADMEMAVIAGTRSMSPLFSALIPGPDDGKVSVRSAFAMPAETKVTMPVSHTWMMMSPGVIREVRDILCRTCT